MKSGPLTREAAVVRAQRMRSNGYNDAHVERRIGSTDKFGDERTNYYVVWDKVPRAHEVPEYRKGSIGQSIYGTGPKFRTHREYLSDTHRSRKN